MILSGRAALQPPPAEPDISPDSHLCPPHKMQSLSHPTVLLARIPARLGTSVLRNE